MPFSLLDVFVPSATRALHALDRLLDLASAQDAAPALLAHSLVPDMFPFHRQIDIVTHAVHGTVEQLRDGRAASAVFNRGLPHEFTSAPPDLAALRAQVEAARAQLATLRADDLLDASTPVRVTKPGEQRVFASRQSFVIDFVVPNLFFHVSIAYAILRAAGVAVGKGDYMGQDAYEVEHPPLPGAPTEP